MGSSLGTGSTTRVYTLASRLRRPKTMFLPAGPRPRLPFLLPPKSLSPIKLGNRVDRFAEFLINARNRLVVKANIMRETVNRLLLIAPLYNGNCRSDTPQRLRPSTASVSTPDVATTRLLDLKRTAENTPFTLQKIGRSPENVLFALVPYGYSNTLWLQNALITK